MEGQKHREDIVEVDPHSVPTAAAVAEMKPAEMEPAPTAWKSFHVAHRHYRFSRSRLSPPNAGMFPELLGSGPRTCRTPSV